ALLRHKPINTPCLYAYISHFRRNFSMSHRTSTRALRTLVDAGLSGTTDRRSLLKMAGVAAAASGMAMTFPHGLPRTAAQAEDNIFIFGSGQDMSNLDPHTGSDYSIIWGQR